MKRFFISVIIMASMLFVANGQEAGLSDNRHIHIYNRLERNVTPDEIFINIRINEKDSKGKISVAQQEESMIKAIKVLGIDIEKCLKVNDIASSLKTHLIKKDDIFLSKEYTLKTKTASEAVSVINALNQIGISDVEVAQIKLSSELENQIKTELLVEASKKCKENATVMAEALGCSIGKVLYMETNISNSYVQPRLMIKGNAVFSAEDSIAFEESAPELEIQQIPISINVTCKFEIL